MGVDRHTLGSHLVTWHCWLLFHHAGQGGFGCSTSKQKGHDLLWVFLTFSPRWHLCCNWCHPKLTTNFIARFDFRWLNFALVILLRSCRWWFEVLGSINVLLPWWKFLNILFLILSQGCDLVERSTQKWDTGEFILLRTQDGTWMFHNFIIWIASVCPSFPRALLDACGPCDFHKALLKYQQSTEQQSSQIMLSTSQWILSLPIFFFLVMIWIYNNIASCTSATVGGKNRALIKYRQKWENNILKFQCLHKSVGEPLSSL